MRFFIYAGALGMQVYAMRKFLIGLLIFASIAMIGFAGYFLYVIIDTKDDFSEKVVIRNEGMVEEVIEVSNLSLIPSESKEYEIELVSTLDGDFFVILDYNQTEDGGLGDHVDVVIMLDGGVLFKGKLSELFEDDFVTEIKTIFVANQSQLITITYSMDTAVGNEAKNTFSTFEITLTIKRNVGE